MATRLNLTKPLSGFATSIGPAKWIGLSKIAWAAILFLLVVLVGCQRSSQEPVTVTFLDVEWDTSTLNPGLGHELEDFTKKTGIQVNRLPRPDGSLNQLALWRELLQKGAAAPDVVSIDVIWSGILNPYLMDLKPYFAEQVSSQNPVVLASYTVGDKLVAIPHHAYISVLYYRPNLLRKYGYREPPKTWDELEKMATRIQAGERAKCQKDFWGYVWPGVAGEGLFCDALEWQAAAGGGHVIEADGRVSVNNPDTIGAWKRAARWIGTISPPTVLSYQEWDSSNAYWTSGRAAFQRGWESDYFLANPVTAYPFNDRSGITSVPGEKGRRVGTLGGLGLAVSRSSKHQTAAIALARFLLRKEAELDQKRAALAPANAPKRFEIPMILTAYTHQQVTGGVDGAHLVARPSAVTGAKYSAVSSAYVQALHSVLEHGTDAETAVASLQKQLSEIMATNDTPQ